MALSICPTVEVKNKKQRSAGRGFNVHSLSVVVSIDLMQEVFCLELKVDEMV